MKIYAVIFALTATQAMAHDNLEVDSMLSILAKPKLAMKNEYQPVNTIKSEQDFKTLTSCNSIKVYQSTPLIS